MFVCLFLVEGCYIQRLARRDMLGYHILSSLQEVLIPEMKWRKACSGSPSLSLPDNISHIPTDSTDSCFPSMKPLGSGEFSVLSVATAFRGLTFSLPRAQRGQPGF